MSTKKNSREHNHKNKNKKKFLSKLQEKIRKDFFDAGGSLSNWRGRATTFKDKREKRKNNRSVQVKKAVDDSNED